MVKSRFLVNGDVMMMSEQESCSVSGGSGISPVGRMIRRRSKEWVLPNSGATTSGGDGISNVANSTGQSGVITESLTSALTAVVTSPSSVSSTQFRELIEMLLYCYLEYGGTQRSEQFRNLVEVFLCPIFEPVSRSNQAGNSSAGVATGSGSNAGVSSVNTQGSLGTSVEGSADFNLIPQSSSPGTSGKDRGANKLCNNSKVESSGVSSNTSNNNMTSSMLCPVCCGILIEPVTVQCGHSYCKKCAQKEMAGRSCRRCNHFMTSGEVSQCKTNVLMGELVEKWWPDNMKATRLRNEGNKCFEGKQVEKALEKYTKALEIVPEDHLSLGNRSHCLLTAGKSEEALVDAEAAIRSCAVWAKGYYRKSAALISLGRYEEAFLSLTVCMYLVKTTSSKKSSTPSSAEDPARTQVINEMIKILQKIFLQSTNAAVGSTLKRHNLGTESSVLYTPYPGARRRISYNRKEWNDSAECNSSGDESDHVIQAHSQHSRKLPGRRHRNQSEQQVQRSSSSPTVVEQLSFRMSRLFCRASQDLKSFESRLGSDGSQGVKVLPRVEKPKDVSANDLECSLCYRLLFQPVSTECGHTFCRSCLDRCMDHNPSCPLCKTGLQSYLATREHAVTEFLENCIKCYLPKEYDERLSQHVEELNSVADSEGKDPDVDIPIFVCTMAFPTIPCPLHVFEPRYRLMIRRCMENGSNRFGMCCYLSEGDGNYGEIGTLLEIRNIQYFADGRSVVDTVGCRRFKVLNKSIVDGYNAARIELLHDIAVESDEEIAELTQLHDKVLEEATEWLRSVGQVRRQRINSHFGQMPAPETDWIGSADGPSWAWWLLAILPLDSKAQLAILSMCSLQKRLECILKVLSFIKNRMASNGE